MKYLGLDLGSRTLGIAISDKTGLIASSYKTIRHNEEYIKLLDDIEKIVLEEKIECVVLGYPKNMDNSVGVKAKLSEDFKRLLEEKIDIPVYLQDERLTTKEATDVLILGNTSRKKRKKIVDAMAATIILQSFVDKRRK